MTGDLEQWTAEWLAELLDAHEAIRWPCGHIGIRRCDYAGAYYEHRCGCELPGRLGEMMT